MDLSKVLTELREELANLDAAILSLERLQQEGRRRGRPPTTISNLTKARTTRRAGTGEGPEPDGS